MENDNEKLKQILTKAFTASLIHFSVIAFIVLVCFWAFMPFLPILMWALVLAIALYPVRQFLGAKLGWSAARASTLIAIVGVLLLGVPTAMVGNSFASKIFGTYESYEAGELVVPKPTESVKEWPLIGEKMHDAWDEAAADLPRFVEKRQPQLKNLSSWFLERASGAARSVFILIGAIIIAGIMLAWAEPGSHSMRRIFISFSDNVRGPELHTLTTATIRQVAVGIIGIAFLTAIIFGATVALSGVPAAALFTLIALIFAIMQLPVTIVALVVVAILWSSGDSSTLHNSIFTVLIIAASLVDNFLKPMILGRGLEVPMPVVLIGAIGGMMSGGILGMFIGAAFLSAGYQVFMKWVESESEGAEITNDKKEITEDEG
ncbi:AI-2E family transporter [Photobacterium sp. DNB23_23_1]|uniref:AI-2E family transporter n=1 Tax=Photobacterium pectinilyticum TaxID=2906793 RepID=A0ABT1MWK5_9GAMM|nr:AI-2E family transporter [Photobacterium sp. ZSDE20]MCQ1056845.1 AI-2E family transporter [Photobacterium sp. ZSDE20]MDD1820980.1 AI-2E family transporter [Photobacterium sp. ZSDE20]